MNCYKKSWFLTSLFFLIIAGILFYIFFPWMSVLASQQLLPTSFQLNESQPQQLDAGINYPPSITTDQQKLYAVYSLIEQLRLEVNKVGDIARSDPEKYIKSGKWAEYTKIYKAKVHPLLVEQDRLRKAVYYSYWDVMSEEEKSQVVKLVNDNKLAEKVKPTAAKSETLDQLKKVKIDELDGKFVDPIENFTSATWNNGVAQSDPASDLTIASNVTTATTLARNVDCWFYRNTTLGTANFTYFAEVCLISGTTGRAGYLMLADYTGEITDAGNTFGMMLYDQTIMVVAWASGVSQGSDTYAISLSRAYWITMEFLDPTINLYIYDDEAKTSWLDTPTKTIAAYFPINVDHIYAVQSRNTASTASHTVWIANIDLQEEEGIVAPSVTTSAATLVEETTATLNGNVTDTGGENVTRWFYWDTDLAAPYSTNWSEGTYGTGAYTHNLDTLDKGDGFVFMASANNSAGTGNGSALYFITKPDPAIGFTSTDNGTTWLYYSWTNSASMDAVELRYQSGLTAPTDNTSGIQGYYGTGTTANVTGLAPGVTYTAVLFTYAKEAALGSVSDNSPTAQSTTDSVGAGGLLLEDFEDVSEWTVQGSATDNISYYKEGTQSISVNSISGAAANITKTVSYPLPTMDNLSMWIYTDNTTNLYSIYFYLSSTTDLSKYFYRYINPSYINDGWNRINLIKSDFTNSGGDSWDNTMVRVKFRVTADASTNSSACFDDLRLNVSPGARVIMGFDDGDTSIMENAYPIMQANGQAGTAFVSTGKVGGVGKMTTDNLTTLYNNGWDISSHGVNHVNWTTTGDLMNELAGSYNWLVNNGFSSSAMFSAYPQGAYSDNVIAAMKTVGFVQGRGTSAQFYFGHMLPDGSIEFKLKCESTGSGDLGLSDAENMVDNITKRQSYLIFGFHGVVDSDNDTEEWLTSDFQDLSDYLKTKEDAGLLEVVTLSEYWEEFGYNVINSPGTENMGNLDFNLTYYAFGSAPSNPVEDDECTFTATNNGTVPINLYIRGEDLVDGTNLNLTSGVPGVNEVRITAYCSGQDPGAGVVITSDNLTLYENLAVQGIIKWDFKVETGTSTDNDTVSGNLTLRAKLPE